MNPNSPHQRWSYWKFSLHTPIPFLILTRFARSLFGSASEMKITFPIVEIRSEGHNVHDPEFRKYMHRQWGKIGGRLLRAKLLAGSREDGKPSKQWIAADVRPLLEKTNGE